jgi:hypothetical protein
MAHMKSESQNNLMSQYFSHGSVSFCSITRSVYNGGGRRVCGHNEMGNDMSELLIL